MNACVVMMGLLGASDQIDRSHPVLTSELSTNNRLDLKATSAVLRLAGRTTLVVNAVQNFGPLGAVGYRNRSSEVGRVPVLLTADGGPATVTRSYTTYRSVGERGDGLDYFLAAAPNVPTSVTLRRWLPVGPPALAATYRVLAAALRTADGDRVVCTSTVAGSEQKGFVYSYTVRNDSAGPLTFTWGRYEGKLAAGKSQTFEAKSADVFAEESGLCTASFGGGPEFAFLTTAWRPAR